MDGDGGFDARLAEIEARYMHVQDEMSSPGVASDPDKLRELGRLFSALREIVEPYHEYVRATHEAESAHELAQNESDAEMVAYLKEEAAAAEAKVAGLRAKLELLLVPKDPDDGKDVLLEVRAGTGGREAALWAGELFEMYRRYAERRKWRTDVLSSSPSEQGGFKEVVLEVRGGDAYSRLKRESGVHRVQRVPVTESSGRIHTSTATIAVMPEAEEVEVEIRPEDIDLQVYRSQGPGGQGVNTTDSAVRITHVPSGIVVAMQDERSQLKNRDKAMRVLRARLYEHERLRQRSEESAARRAQIGGGERAEKIRTYNFPENRLTDHRVKLTQHRLDSILQGDLDEFTAALTADAQRRALEED